MFDNFVNKLKNIAKRELKIGKIEHALKTIEICAGVLYQVNPIYSDDELEKLIVEISERIFTDKGIRCEKENAPYILFYDGFGLNSRGLAQIYLKALCKIAPVIYVTYEMQKNCIPDLLNILNESNASVCFLKQTSIMGKIKELDLLIQKYNPKMLMMYTIPNDVVVTTVYARYAGYKKRYQINLTDHAFWLGKCAMDYCIEFRDYGANISKQYRNIPSENLIKLPFYPIIDYEKEFEGFPFEVDETKQKIVFSGGSLYKTLGGGNKYYQIIDYILEKYEDTIFWYAGVGEQSEMNKILKKYPQRAILTQERNDLYCILKRCFFYLSTYPVCGGLMFQYASAAGKIPVTLKYDQISDDFLLEQNELQVEFEDLTEVYMEIDRLFQDENYRGDKEKKVGSALIEANVFEAELESLLKMEKTSYKIDYKDVNTFRFRKEYWERQKQLSLYEAVVCKNSQFLLKYMPYKWCIALISKVIKKLKRDRLKVVNGKK